MNRITFPLQPNDTGSAVADLQAGLHFLLDRNFFSFDKVVRAEAIRQLNDEARQSAYGAETKRLVTTFQKLVGLPTDDIVNEATAIALNDRLAELGAFNTAAVPRLVTGKVSQESGEAIPNAPVRAFHVGDDGALRLGADTTDPDGGYTIAYPMPPGLAAIQLRVVAYADNKVIADSGLLPNAPPLQFVDLKVAPGADSQYTVTGRITSPTGAGVGGLRVQIVDKGVGGDHPLIETESDAGGVYRVTFGAGLLNGRSKQRPDLQARVLRGQTFLGASAVRYQAATAETLDVRLPETRAAALASEHEALAFSLAAIFKGSLADLQETEERQDITFLANRTQWDARLVLMSALGEGLSLAAKKAGAVIDPALFYALFRAGLPTDEDALFAVDSAVAGRIWRQAITQGVIPASLEPQLRDAQAAFQKLVADRALAAPPTAGFSPLKELLAVAVPPLPNRQEQQAREALLADLLTRHRDDPATLWQAVRTNFDKGTEQRMQMDGKLARLTGSHAPLMTKLHALAGGRMQDPQELVRLGFYAPTKWQDALTGLAIPRTIPGQNDAEKRAHYADLLARQVRLGFPTATIAQKVLTREMRLLDPAGKPIADQTITRIHAFLTEQQGKFELGQQPVQQYVQQNKVAIEPDVSQAITRIQRVLQITPDDASMNALLGHNVDSAHKVAQYSRDEFVAAFKDDVGGEVAASLIHARAQQISVVTLKLITDYGLARTAPGIGAPAIGAPGSAAARIIDPPPTSASSLDSGVLAIPTLENLFGSLDFCDCEHCRSMLSPAAYLVDLLHWIDRDDAVWATFLTRWRADHGDAPYPFASQEEFKAAQQPAGTEITPLQVLLARRPDLQHLPLTCENTNTPLPYIDLVNEVLESFVANGSLAGYEGHNTDGSTNPEELLANPQFVAREAYKILAQAHFPPPLPFDQPLESVRRYLARSAAPLAQVMEDLRKDDTLAQPGDDGYGWRDILMEELRLNREEYKLLTQATLSTGAFSLQDLYGFPPGTTEEAALARLSFARDFARRMDLSYENLLEILKTQFVNPAATLIPRLERLGVPLATLKELRQKLIAGTITPAQLRAELAPGLDETHYGGDVVEWVRNEAQFNKIMHLLTLAGPNATEDCSFEKLQFRYADPAQADQFVKPLEFVRLLRFIRLWKKLGWTIAYTDKAIMALYPSEQIPKPEETDDAALAKLNNGFLTLLPRLGVLRRVMRALKLNSRQDLLPTLALFAPLDTHSEHSLYRALFLGPALAKQDPAFADNGFGNFLVQADKLLRHRETLRAAFALTGEEFDLIVAALRFDADTALTLDKISALYRRGWLARTLKLSVRELLLLIEYTGLDPFAPPDPPDPSLTPARPLASIERLLELLDHLRRVGLKPAQALYLFWHQDVSGKSTPEESEVLDFARNLRLSLAGIDQEFASVDDPGGEIARARMALVFGSEATDLFFGLLDRTFTTDVQYDHTASLLEKPILDAASGQIAYDDFRKRLLFQGLMTEGVRTALKAAGPAGNFSDAVDRLFTENQKTLAPFFARYPELLPLHDAFVFFGNLRTVVAYTHHEERLGQPIVDTARGRITYDPVARQLAFQGVLRPALRDVLAALPAETAQFRAAVDELLDRCQNVIADFFERHKELQKRQEDYLAADDSREKRLKLLLTSLLPELTLRRKQQQAAQALAATAATEVEFARTVLDNQPLFTAPLFDPKPALVYVLHAAGDAARPALDDLVATERQGLSVQFFFNSHATGEAGPQREGEANLIYTAEKNPLPQKPAAPGSPVSGIWRGYLEVPEDDFYSLSVEAETGSKVTLNLDGSTVTFQQTGPVFSNVEPLELRAGTLYAFALTVENLKTRLAVRWATRSRGLDRGLEPIPAALLYPATGMATLSQLYLRFLKAASLAAALKLDANELAYLAAHPQHRIDGQGWLNLLPTISAPVAQTPVELPAVLNALVDFARFKAAFGAEDDALLSVLQNPPLTEQSPTLPLFALTRWDPASLDALLAHFGKGRKDLADLTVFRQIYDAMAWIKQTGIAAPDLIAAATNAPQPETATRLQSALRARFNTGDWLKIVKPINDELRAAQRDALVAHILQGMRAFPATEHIDTPEKLFEFFLMDVQMEPCMQTSRVRHALSAVQLFIERCLMNLEPGVSPQVLNAGEWEWMNRYRVWEANRKVFLFPENWLEPELRDDQSPFFKETMSELLQSDITEESAQAALLNYLAKLQEVAKLEPCGIYYEEDDTKTEIRDDVVHVVARTGGAHRKYYYRRREYGSWTPWKHIPADIEDNPVLPVVWNNRLLLFWLRILQQGSLAAPTLPPDPLGGANASKFVDTNATSVIAQAVLSWSEYYNGKWQPTRTSDLNQPLPMGSYNPNKLNSLRQTLALSSSEVENALEIRILGAVFTKPALIPTFTLYNTHSLPVTSLARVEESPVPTRNFHKEGDTFTIDYNFAGVDQGLQQSSQFNPLVRPILKNRIDDGSDQTVAPHHALENAWDAPFLFADGRHVFFVTTEERLVSVPEWEGFAPLDSLDPGTLVVPKLIQREAPVPQRTVPVAQVDGAPVGSGVGAAGRTELQRFFSEDAFIHRGIATLRPVRLGKIVIGPAGGLLNGEH